MGNGTYTIFIFIDYFFGVLRDYSFANTYTQINKSIRNFNNNTIFLTIMVGLSNISPAGPGFGNQKRQALVGVAPQ